MFLGNNVFDYNLDSPKKVQSHKVMSEDIKQLMFNYLMCNNALKIFLV
jgi:hypothetical protein